MTALNNLEVREYLPHRYPFLMIDRVLEVIPNESITAVKNITANEPQFTGHLPLAPVMPGVLMVEALAQAGGILTYKSLGILPDTNNFYYFAGVDNVRFKKIVIPGDVLTLKVNLLKNKKDLWKFEGVAMVDEQVACSATFMTIKGDLNAAYS